MADKPKTRPELEAAIADLETRLKQSAEAADTYKRAAVAAETRESQTRAQFDDLKIRLATAEAENQRMRGYIARVHEDDVVREELVTIGEAGGEQQLVPKRKPTAFYAPHAFSDVGERVVTGSMYQGCDVAERRKPKHWVTY